MSQFICRECQVIENTSNCHYWSKPQGTPCLCSQCDPNINRWHKRFPRNFIYDKGIKGTLALGENGYVYNISNPPTHTKILGIL